MEELKKRIVSSVKAMFVECEHGSIEPVELVEQLNELVADCNDDVKGGGLTERERESVVNLIEREANRINVNLLNPELS
jgi:hypothetical protein